MKALKLSPQKKLEDLEPYGWELDMVDCLTTCDKCGMKNKCPIKEEQHYTKSICKTLHYTSIYISKIQPVVYGVFDEFQSIDYTDKDYSYVIKSCEREITDGLLILEEII